MFNCEYTITNSNSTGDHRQTFIHNQAKPNVNMYNYILV